jgi:DNA-binding XRE family transcriptional regulator
MIKEKFKPVEYDHDATLKKELKNPKFRKEYEALEDEFALLDTFLKARRHAHMTQEEVAEAMHTSRSTVARIESSGGSKKHSPSLHTLRKYARAVGCKLKIDLVPIK